MYFSVIGMSFHETKPERRELYAFGAKHIQRAYEDFQKAFDSSALVILSTCNRVELYSSVLDYVELLRWWANFHQRPTSELEQICYFYTRMSALRHLTHVCTGIDSLVIGENQILGQVKESYQQSVKRSLAIKDLRLCFEQAFAMSKKVKSHTLLSTSQISVASIAVKESLLEDDASTKYLVIGAGQTGELILRYLHQHTRDRITLINRTDQKALLVAEKYGVQADKFENFDRLVRQADVIFCATASTEPLIVKETFTQNVIYSAPFLNSQLLDQKKMKKNIFDLSMPRNCCPTIETLEGVKVVSVDQLQEIAQKNNKARRTQVLNAQDLVEKDLEVFIQKIHKRKQASDIKNYQQRCLDIKEQLLKESLKNIENENTEQVLKKFAQKLLQKITHEPLKNCAHVDKFVLSCPVLQKKELSILDEERIHFIFSSKIT